MPSTNHASMLIHSSTSIAKTLRQVVIVLKRCRTRFNLLTFAVWLLCALFMHNGLCADLGALPFSPSGLEAGLVGKSISTTPTQIAPKKLPVFAMPKPQGTTALSAEMAKISFVLNQVNIVGNHVFSTAELEAIFKADLHHTITLAQLQKHVDAITEKYQTAGYFLSKAILPPQSIKNGVVKVEVVEGFISHIEIQGINNTALTYFLKHYEKNIKASKPIKLAELERMLLLINDVPGIQVKSVLAPDPKIQRAATLTLVTTYKPISLNATYDNYQTLFLGPYETNGFASLNSMIIPGGTVFARALSSNHFKQLNYFEINDTQTLGTNGLVLNVDAFQTHTHPMFTLTPLEIFGFSGDGNISLTYPLIRSRERTLSVLALGEYMSNNSKALGQLLYNDEIRDLTFGAVYNDVLWKGEDAINLTYVQGFNVFGANHQTLTSRLGAVPNFSKLVFTASRTQYLTDRFSLYALVTTQYTNKILFSAETMIYGGSYIGRGYDWAQFTGDRGVEGKAEFRVNTAPGTKFLKQVQYYGFYDAGKLWSLITGVRPISAASAGVGVRASIIDHLNVEGFAGRPLTAPNATQIIQGKSGHQWMYYFQVSAYL